MGLIKALTSSTSSALGDQFKEFITCPALENGVLIQRGTVNHGEGNKNFSENIISNGSTIVVPSGMAMMIIDNGEIKEFTSEPGTFTYDSSTEPSIFYGGLGKGIIDTFKTIGKRFTYGGQPAKDQRVYYVNLLTITGNKFGSPQPKKITDEKYGMLEVTFFGEYAFRVVDPIILVNQVIGANPKDTVTYEEIVGSQLKNKFIEKLTQAISIVMRKHKVSFGDMGLYGSDLSEEMNACLDESWKKMYGLTITDVALADVNLTEESMARINKIDDATIFANTSLQSGLMASATADAMKMAASNENGAMTGFMGMGMAQGQGANVIGAVNQANNLGSYTPQTNMPEPGTIFKEDKENNNTVVENNEIKIEDPKKEENNIGNVPKFCFNCGTPAVGKFCGNCGTKLY
ncbi:MAG: SPFH domain-containing protein [Bacilli bacterium]|nr:SPFH domain-containing protein [Bacilli bacterium]